MVAREPEGSSEAEQVLKTREDRHSRVEQDSSEEEEAAFRAAALEAVERTAPEAEGAEELPEEAQEELPKEEPTELPEERPELKESRDWPEVYEEAVDAEGKKFTFQTFKPRRSEPQRGHPWSPAVRLEPNPAEQWEEVEEEEEQPNRAAPSVSQVKQGRGRGFRLRSTQSRQYRNLKSQLKLAAKVAGGKVPRKLKEEVKEFGNKRSAEEKRLDREEERAEKKRHVFDQESSEEGRGLRLRSVSSIRRESGSRIRLRSVPRGLVLREATREQGGDQTKVRGRALKLSLNIRNLAERCAARREVRPYHLESPFQVRKLAAEQLLHERRLRGSVGNSEIRRLWNEAGDEGQPGSNEACSSCDERRQASAKTVVKYIQKRNLTGAVAPKAKTEPKAGRNPATFTREPSVTSEIRRVPRRSFY